MKYVRIYQQSKSQMQSGQAGVGTWIIEPELQSSRQPEPLMGWTSSGDTLSQMKLEFPSQYDAEQFAKSNGWRYTTSNAQVKKVKPRNYGDNFVYEPVAKDIEKKAKITKKSIGRPKRSRSSTG